MKKPSNPTPGQKFQDATLLTASPLLKNRRDISGQIKIFPAPQGQPINGSYDFFGHLIDESGVLEAKCSECGQPFKRVAKNGRPLAFCSQLCRRASNIRNGRKWSQQQSLLPSADQITCRGCGLLFPTPRRRAGRFPHWCSPACKQISLRKSPPSVNIQHQFEFPEDSK